MVQILEPFQDITDVLCSHTSSLGQDILWSMAWTLAEELQVDVATQLHPRCTEGECRMAV